MKSSTRKASVSLSNGYRSHDPFIEHLTAILAIYEGGQSLKAQIPQYDGVQTTATEGILSSIKSIATRMYKAEELLRDENVMHAATTSKKRRSEQYISSFSQGHHTGFTTFDRPPPPEAMNIDLEQLPDPREAMSMAGWTYPSTESVSKPQLIDRDCDSVACPTCGRVFGDHAIPNSTAFATSNSSPMIVPTGGALALASFESGMSAVEELRLLKAQVEDVARVCQAVAEGDLSQKITVLVQGPVMSKLKDVINGMVNFLSTGAFLIIIIKT